MLLKQNHRLDITKVEFKIKAQFRQFSMYNSLDKLNALFDIKKNNLEN